MLVQILDDARAGNRALADAMAPPHRAAMHADPRWWSPEAYAGRTTAPVMPPPADPTEIAEICRQLEAAIPDAATAAPPASEARCVDLARQLHARTRRAAGHSA